MDKKIILEQLDSIIEDLTNKDIHLTKKDIKLIGEIIDEVGQVRLDESEELKRTELLGKLDAVKEAVNNNETVSKDSSQRIIDAIEKIKIEAPIVKVEPPKVEVPPVDLSKIKLVMPDEMNIKKPSWLSSLFDQNLILKALGEVKNAIVNFVFPDKPDKPISVRLTDGEKFYRAMGGGSSSVNTIFQFKKANNEASAGLVDNDAHLQVDVLEMPEGLATESKQDEIIEAIDQKVIPLVDVSELATEAKQDLLLNEVVKKTEPDDIQMGELIPMLRSILTAIANPSYVDKSANQMRSQVTGSLTTITTVTTVTNLTNIGSFSADHLQRMTNIDAWSNNVRSLIT